MVCNNHRGGFRAPTIQTDVISTITIGGKEYSTNLTQLRLNGSQIRDISGELYVNCGSHSLHVCAKEGKEMTFRVVHNFCQFHLHSSNNRKTKQKTIAKCERLW